MAENIRVKVLGDITNFTSSMSDVERVAELTAGKIKDSFLRVGGFLKTTIGLTAVGVGLEQAVTSASSLVNLQKVQSKLIQNQGIAKQYQLTGDQASTRWYSQRLDDMATQLSLQNGINKASIVQSQTFIMSNQDLVTMTGSMKDGMKTVLSDAANIAEITGGNITSTTRMLTRMLADPAKSMSSMRRMGFQLSQAEQTRIKALEKSGGLLKAQDLTIQLIGKHTAGIAQAAQSPVDLLKNEVSLIWQSLGLGLLPILDQLAQAVIKPVEALMPVLQFMGKTIATVANTLGGALGNIFADMVPLFQLMTNAIIPALLNIVTPLIQLVDAVLTPLSKVFAGLVGTADHLGPLAKIFKSIGDAINVDFMKAVHTIVSDFNDMAHNGKLNLLFETLIQAVKNLAPILPALANSMVQLFLAMTPLVIQSLPIMVELIKLLTQLLADLTPIITGVASGFTQLVQHLGPLKGVVEGLLAVWFTKKLFIEPVMFLISPLINLYKWLQAIKTLYEASTAEGFVMKLITALRAKGGLGKGIEGALVSLQVMAMRTGEFFKAFWIKVGEDGFLSATGIKGAWETSLRIVQNAFGLMKTFARIAFDAVVGAARSAGALMKNAWEASLRAVGTAYEAMKGVAKTAFDAVVSAAQSAANLMKTAFGAVKTFMVETAIPAITGAFNRLKLLVVETVVPAIVEGFGAIRTAILTTVIPAIEEMYATIMADPWVLVATLILAAVVGLTMLIIDHWRGVVTFFTDAWNIMWNVAKSIINFIKDHWQIFLIALTGPFGIAVALIVKYWNDIKDAGIAVWNGIKSAFDFVWNGFKVGFNTLKGWWNDVINTIKSAGMSMWDSMYNGFVKAANLIISAYNNTLGSLLGAFGISAKISLLTPIGAPPPVQKKHNGGIVAGLPGREVPAILQAGEAVMSIQQMKNLKSGGSSHLSVAPNAVNIVVNGNADAATTAEIKRHVEAQFKELHRTLRGMGR